MNENRKLMSYKDEKRKSSTKLDNKKRMITILSFILSSGLFLLAIAVLIRIFLPSQILTIRALTACAIIIAGILLLTKEMGSFGDNLASLGKSYLNYKVWLLNYNSIFATSVFNLTEEKDIRSNFIVNSIFSKVVIKITKEQFHFLCLGYCSTIRLENKKIISFWGVKNIDSKKDTFEIKIQAYFSNIFIEII